MICLHILYTPGTQMNLVLLLLEDKQPPKYIFFALFGKLHPRTPIIQEFQSQENMANVSVKWRCVFEGSGFEKTILLV